MAKTERRKKATFGKVITLLLVFATLLTMFAGCTKKGPETRFQERKSYSTVPTTEGATVLQDKVLKLLEENGIVVQNSYISVDYIDGFPYIFFDFLKVEKDGSKTIKTYLVKTDYDGPITSAFSFNSDIISVYGDILYIKYYFEYADYALKGEEIVVTE